MSNAPFAAAVGRDGQVTAVAVLVDEDASPSADIVEASIEALAAQRDSIRAGVIVSDVRLVESRTDAVRVDLEHADGHAMAVLLPYTKKRLGRGIDYGPIRAEAGSSRIWT